MLKFKVTGVNIQADVNQGDMTSVTLHTLVTSDRKPGSAEELEKIARAVGVLCDTDLEPGYEVNLAPFGYTFENVDGTLNYEEQGNYNRVKTTLGQAFANGVYPIEAIKALEGPEGPGMLLAVRDWLNEVTQ